MILLLRQYIFGLTFYPLFVNSVPHVKAHDVFAQASFWSFRWLSTASHHRRFLSEFLHSTHFSLEMLYLRIFKSAVDFCFHSANSLSLPLKYLNLSHSETF